MLIDVVLPILIDIIICFIFWKHLAKYKVHEKKINDNIHVLSRNDRVISNEINKIISLQQQINALLNTIHSNIKSLKENDNTTGLASKLANATNLNTRLLNEIRFMKQESKEHNKMIKD